MTIVLLILKITGCILLALIILLILLILLLLFVPVRYRISASLQDDSRVKAQASWLLHLVALTGVYEDGKFHLKLRVLFWGKLLMDTAQAKATAEEGEEKTEETLKKAAEEITDDTNLWEIPEKEITEKEIPEKEIPEKEIPKKEIQIKKIPEKEIPEQEKPKKPNGYHRKKGVPVFIQLAKDLIHRIQELRKDSEKVINQIKSISDDDRCRSALTHLKEELFLLLKMLWPRKIRMNLQFSAGSPDKTGQILGVCALFPVTYSRGNQLVPDFETEESYAKGYANLKGRVYLYQIVGIAIRVIFDKNCRRLLHRIQAIRS